MGAPIDLSKSSVLGASGIGALGSIGSTLINSLFNQSSMNRQVEASKELMEYEWKHFKSPSAQVGALASAGINPAVAFGNNSGAIATPSPVMPQSIPPSMDLSGVGNFVKAMADAKKAGLESVGQQLENEFNEQTLKDRVSSVALANKWSQSQIEKVDQEISNLVANLNVLRHEAKIKEIDADTHRDMIEKQIKSYVSQYNLDNERANEIRELLPEKLNQLKAQNTILGVEASIQEDYGKSLKSLGVVGDIVKIITGLVKAFK